MEPWWRRMYGTASSSVRCRKTRPGNERHRHIHDASRPARSPAAGRRAGCGTGTARLPCPRGAAAASCHPARPGPPQAAPAVPPAPDRFCTTTGYASCSRHGGRQRPRDGVGGTLGGERNDQRDGPQSGAGAAADATPAAGAGAGPPPARQGRQRHTAGTRRARATGAVRRRRGERLCPRTGRSPPDAGRPARRRRQWFMRNR